MIGRAMNAAAQMATLPSCARIIQMPATMHRPAPTLNSVRPRSARPDIITPPAICRPAASRLISPSMVSSAVNP